MTWTVEFSPAAVRALLRMPTNTARLLRGKIDQLATDPHAPNNNVKALKGVPAYRLRVGDWRVIYELRNEVLVVHVVAVAPRGRAYD